MFLTMEADCIREELYRFFGRTIDAPSKAAFYRQRKKIREDAFRNLLLAFNRKLPKKLYNGKYEFWACDGSSCDIFLNPEDKDTYLNQMVNLPEDLTRSISDPYQCYVFFT